MAVDAVAEAYRALSGLDEPNPMQRQVWECVSGGPWGTGLLLMAPTGTGKTEAVALPALAQGGRRLIMVYPSRSLVDDQVRRFERMLAGRSAQAPGRAYTLVVDTGAVSHRYTWRDGERVHATGNPRRHLYQGDVIITTLDKFLYRFFAFGERAKSYIFPLRIHYGARKTLICFDEAHAYDDVAFTNFSRLVRALYGKGMDVVLMTATMPPEFAAEFAYLETIDYVQDPARREELAAFARRLNPRCGYPHKRLRYLPVPVDAGSGGGPSPAVEAMARLAAERMAPGRRVIVAVERVTDAVAVYRRLAGHEGCPLLLYHGRLTASKRAEVYGRLLEIEQQGGGYALVTTSAIEVGCDLNAHALITQLCDPERLIQRAGRCNRRHDMPDAEVIVVGDRLLEWESGLAADEAADYVAELRRQDGQPLDTLALAACIRKHPNADYRVEVMFDMLYEYVYEARLENKGLHDHGLVVTRSWEPTLTLCTGYDEHGRPLHALDVPMSQCVAYGGEPLTPGVRAFKETFDWREQRPHREPLGRWDCAYATDIVVELQGYPFDEEVGYVELPKVFGGSYASGYRRVLVRDEGGDRKQVWYIAPLRPATGAAGEEGQAEGEEDAGAGDAD